ncbi:BTAD domain-containing putative transcriptional regulator [Micromonospora sp. NPDC049102]|uniref:AfsR/SARP family transcriptional regulator n=1 Tax=Micromonospora sp. NPDC049102 TaxID=3364265 RepID=UPI00371C4455
MEFRILGPFEAIDDGKLVQLGRRRRQERLVLATLLIDADRLVSMERIFEVLWASQTPRSARSAVQTYVNRVRSDLAPYGVQIVTRGDRYLLRTEGHRIDAANFGDIAKRAFLTPDPREQVHILDQALALWRGPLLADLTDDVARQRLGGPLIDLWFTCLETRAAAQLARRQHLRVISELANVVDQHPAREALVSSLMTALYRAGRQAEALHLYETTRTTLLRDLGVEPGRQLRELHRRILRVEHPPHQLRHLVRQPPFVIMVGVRW